MVRALRTALILNLGILGGIRAQAKVAADSKDALKTLNSIGDALNAPDRHPVHILYVHGIDQVGAGDSALLRDSICTRLNLCATSDWKSAGVEFADHGEFADGVQPPALQYLGNPVWNNAEEWHAAAPSRAAHRPRRAPLIHAAILHQAPRWALRRQDVRPLRRRRAYPEFVPLCRAMRVMRRTKDGDREVVVAQMTVAYKLIKETFTSRVTLDRERLQILVEYLDGPFSRMENQWHFHSAAETGEATCDVEFFIAYEFKSRTLGLVDRRHVRRRLPPLRLRLRTPRRPGIWTGAVYGVTVASGLVRKAADCRSKKDRKAGEAARHGQSTPYRRHESRDRGPPGPAAERRRRPLASSNGGKSSSPPAGIWTARGSLRPTIEPATRPGRRNGTARTIAVIRACRTLAS